MKKSSGKKRVSSLTFLIATTAVLAAVAVLCLFGSNLLYAMRVRNVNEQRAEVEKRNTERYEAYRQEVQELQDRLTANNNISADWPTPDTQEGISIVDLTNYPLDNPGTVTATKSIATHWSLPRPATFTGFLSGSCARCLPQNLR